MGVMKVSMNGLRKNLTHSFNEFMIDIKRTNTFDNMNDREIDSLESLRAMIGSLNCCYYPEDKEDWDDLSDMKIEDERREE